MAKLPRVTGPEMVGFLEREGSRCSRPRQPSLLSARGASHDRAGARQPPAQDRHAAQHSSRHPDVAKRILAALRQVIGGRRSNVAESTPSTPPGRTIACGYCRVDDGRPRRAYLASRRLSRDLVLQSADRRRARLQVQRRARHVSPAACAHCDLQPCGEQDIFLLRRLDGPAERVGVHGFVLRPCNGPGRPAADRAGEADGRRARESDDPD